jgi:hypothetical protein
MAGIQRLTELIGWPAMSSEHIYQRGAGDGLTAYMGKHAAAPPGWYAVRTDATDGKHRRMCPTLLMIDTTKRWHDFYVPCIMLAGHHGSCQPNLDGERFYR